MGYDDISLRYDRYVEDCHDFFCGDQDNDCRKCESKQNDLDNALEGFVGIIDQLYTPEVAFNEAELKRHFDGLCDILGVARPTDPMKIPRK